jgi:N-formylglutamate amidohydrolase
MTEAPFAVFDPTGPESPVIVEVPHAGVEVAPAFMPEILASARALGRDADLYVDELYGAAPAFGASLLVARASRYVADLNRAETDFDGQAVLGGPATQSPRGVVWRLTTEGDRSLPAPLHPAAYEERMREIYRPYHSRLKELIRAKQGRFGLAVILAGHSMPSLGRAQHTDRGSPRADIVPGTQGRTSAQARFIDVVDAHAREARLSVAHDDPYKGGFTTQHYGRPSEGVHVVQVEIARRLYMDELTLRRIPERFEVMRAWCGELVAKLGRAALT